MQNRHLTLVPHCPFATLGFETAEMMMWWSLPAPPALSRHQHTSWWWLDGGSLVVAGGCLQRHEERSTTTTTSGGTATTSPPTTSGTSPTTSAPPNTTTSTSGGGGGPGHRGSRTPGSALCFIVASRPARSSHEARRFPRFLLLSLSSFEIAVDSEVVSSGFVVTCS